MRVRMSELISLTVTANSANVTAGVLDLSSGSGNRERESAGFVAPGRYRNL